MELVMTDPEFEWLIRTGINAYNVYLTMIHLIIHDSTVDFDDDTSRIISYPLFMAVIDLLIYLSME